MRSASELLHLVDLFEEAAARKRLRAYRAGWQAYRKSAIRAAQRVPEIPTRNAGAAEEHMFRA
jgi:hypothetical protein